MSLAATISAVKRAIPVLMRDVAGVAGVGLVAYGAWRIYEPAGFIVGGLCLVAAAFLLGGRR
jgi:hypothetical protein